MPNTTVQNTLPPMKRFIGSGQSTAGGRSKKTTLTKMEGFIGAVPQYLQTIAHTSPREDSISKVVYCQFLFRNP